MFNSKLKLAVFLFTWLASTVLHAASGNDAISECVDQSETTYAKNKCERKYKGVILDFEGKVSDIKDERKLHVMINADNYADVVFKSAVAEIVKKGEVIKFSGKITSFGTGILISHDINSAILKPLIHSK